MQSLRTRLFIVLLGIFATAWAIALACVGVQVSREQTGLWDRMLAEIGGQVLLSMPGDVASLSGAENLRVGGNGPEKTGYKGRFVFQVWVKSRREIVVRSPEAPTPPLKPDYLDGYATQNIGGEEWRVYALSSADGDVQVQIAKPARDFGAELRRWVLVGLAISVPLLLVLAFAMRWVIRRSLQPVVKVQDAIALRDPLDLAPLPGERLPDEVRPLVESFNQLLARLDRALRNERQFLSEAAHELRTPLAALLTHAQVAQRSQTLEEAKEPLQQLVHGVERSARLSQQLLDSARLDAAHAGERAPLELADIVAVVTHEIDAIAAHKRQSIALDAEPCAIVGNVDDLGILIGNLVDNAVRYTPVGGRIAVRCTRMGACAVLQVLDDGPGVAAADRERIFDRFFRVAGSNQRGSGLGLSLVARIAASHGAVVATGVGLDGRGFGITVSFLAAPNTTPAPTPSATTESTYTPAATTPIAATIALRTQAAHE